MGKMLVPGSTRVMPTFKDGGSGLVDCLDVMLGEDDGEVGVAEGDNTEQGFDECWHNMALASRWWEVCKLELGAGGGACDGAISNVNTDAGGRGVAVVDGGVFSELDAGGSGVCYAGVVDWQTGWVGGGWAAGQ
jgi:hypothetical protein